MRIEERAFKSLTEKQQEVWQIVMRDGGSQYRCARLLKITREAVKDRLNKAKKRFTTFIEENK